MLGRAPITLRQEIARRRSDARAAFVEGRAEEAWSALAEAHVLSQPWALEHTLVHAQMLAVAVRTRDGREVRGQVLRLVLAGLGSATGRFPVGNSGRSDVSAFAEAPVAPALGALLDTYSIEGRASR